MWKPKAKINVSIEMLLFFAFFSIFLFQHLMNISIKIAIAISGTRCMLILAFSSCISFQSIRFKFILNCIPSNYTYGSRDHYSSHENKWNFRSFQSVKLHSIFLFELFFSHWHLHRTRFWSFESDSNLSSSTWNRIVFE